MKNILIAFFTLLSFQTFAQTAADSLLNDLGNDEKPQLLPEKMLITQRLFWGENGIYRKLHIAPALSVENREKEMKIRRTMFKIHQTTGFITAAAMLAQGIVGTKLFNGNYNIKDIHEGLATGINIGYGTTAVMAFTAPPPLINRKGFNSIKLHKILAFTHLTGMIATNILADEAGKNVSMKKWHRAAALTTFGAYAASILAIKFEF